MSKGYKENRAAGHASHCQTQSIRVRAVGIRVSRILGEVKELGQRS